MLLIDNWWQFCFSARQCISGILHSTHSNCCSA